MNDIFTGSFTQQIALPQAAIDAAVEVLNSGRLHRYNTVADEISQTALLEEEFAASVGAKYCLAVASGGYAMGCALRAIGVGPGDKVLSNAFTLAPVPGAIASIGAVPVFVEVDATLKLDLDHLQQQIGDSGAKVLLLSHMRGHICDMGALMQMCAAAGVQVIEDCAHTMAAGWDGTPTGRFGRFGCFSTQTYKHINSGEGGFLVSDDAEAMARAIILSGSYMLYDRHRAAPPAETFERIRLETPNVSGRMDNLRAAILRPQLAGLAEHAAHWRQLYLVMERGLAQTPEVALMARDAREDFVPSSFQFRLDGWSGAKMSDVVARCARRGVDLKWFGADQPHGYTARYDSWAYANPPSLPKTDAVLASLLDMRLPLTFSVDDCDLIARIIREEVNAVGETR